MSQSQQDFASGMRSKGYVKGNDGIWSRPPGGTATPERAILKPVALQEASESPKAVQIPPETPERALAGQIKATAQPIIFFVPGVAKPAGSKTAFGLKSGGHYTGRFVVTDACKGSKPWKKVVSAEAMNHKPAMPLDCPLSARFSFIISRPKCHYRTGKNAHILKDDAPLHPTSKPDVLKLTRAVEDALTKIIYVDDSQIVTEHISKRYGSAPGVNIEINRD